MYMYMYMYRHYLSSTYRRVYTCLHVRTYVHEKEREVVVKGEKQFVFMFLPSKKIKKRNEKKLKTHT